MSEITKTLMVLGDNQQVRSPKYYFTKLYFMRFIMAMAIFFTDNSPLKKMAMAIFFFLHAVLNAGLLLVCVQDGVWLS